MEISHSAGSPGLSLAPAVFSFIKPMMGINMVLIIPLPTAVPSSSFTLMPAHSHLQHQSPGVSQSSLQHPQCPRRKNSTAPVAAERALQSVSLGQAQQAGRCEGQGHNPRSSYPILGLEEGEEKEP